MSHHSAKLTIDLSALAENYRLLQARHAKKHISAVVKANAYGLGVREVSKALWAEGCRDFFVATLEEAIELRSILPAAGIGVFSGIFSGQEREFQQHQLKPVLNDLGMIERWVSKARQSAKIVHIDTGMTRLGLSESDLKIALPLLEKNPPMLMSHLACANEPLHAKNVEQLMRFEAAMAMLPGAKASFANSSGLFLPHSFHFDLGRPGCALYGINPTDGANPMKQVASLCAPILQIRTLDRDETVGYGGTYQAHKGDRFAIVGFGYADGYSRGFSNCGFAYVGGHKIPIAGRVSMDMVALDISKIPEGHITEHMRAEFINDIQPVDDIAVAAGTIGYEIFTRIGARVQRIYK